MEGCFKGVFFLFFSENVFSQKVFFSNVFLSFQKLLRVLFWNSVVFFRMVLCFFLPKVFFLNGSHPTIGSKGFFF